MSKRILLVEDQPDNRQIIRDMLAPTDYEITEARAAGCDAYVPEPYSPRQLLAKIQRCMP
jgi:CheY-like chemotaxis protein